MISGTRPGPISGHSRISAARLCAPLQQRNTQSAIANPTRWPRQPFLIMRMVTFPCSGEDRDPNVCARETDTWGLLDPYRRGRGPTDSRRINLQTAALIESKNALPVILHTND